MLTSFKFRFIAITVCIGIILGLGIIVWRLTDKPPAQPDMVKTLSTSVTSQIKSFTPYYLASSFSTDFQLEPSSVHYQAGVLIFQLKNHADKTLAFTEEPTPPGYDITSLKADKQFDTENGQAFITDGLDRTTGTLFTQDKTWILINAPSPVGADVMQQILSALQPASN